MMGCSRLNKIWAEYWEVMYFPIFNSLVGEIGTLQWRTATLLFTISIVIRMKQSLKNKISQLRIAGRKPLWRLQYKTGDTGGWNRWNPCQLHLGQRQLPKPLTSGVMQHPMSVSQVMSRWLGLDTVSPTAEAIPDVELHRSGIVTLVQDVGDMNE